MLKTMAKCKDILLLALIFSFLIVYTIQAEDSSSRESANLEDNQTLITVRGKIIDVKGEPVVGANITEQGTTRGSVSDRYGEFTMKASPEATLIVSFIGYKKESIALKGRTSLVITLRESSVLLDNVIVTALGLKKKESSLTYAAVEIKGSDFTKVKDANMMMGLTGKVSGMQVNKNASGLGGSAKVLIRGMRSVAGNNQPLYVIDGVPVLNSTTEQAYSAIGGTADAGNRDGGDGISNLNPEDIESVTVLKGSPAAALYGSSAANGVILITTKKGNIGHHKVNFSTSLTFDKAASLPDFQNTYGVSNGVESWGKKASLPVYDHAGDFFKTGLTSITSLSVASGNSNFQNYFSYANTTGKGIVDKNKLSRHNINLRETSNLFYNRLKLDGNVNLIRQTVENRPPSGGFYMNPLVGLYRFPRGMDMSEYKDRFEVYDAERNLNVQNWHSETQDFEQNPYWVINRIQSKSRRTRILLSLSADLKVTDWLKLQARGSMDYTEDKVRQKFYASTAPALAGLNGRYIEMDYEETLLYGDIMALADKKFGDFALHAALGGSINDKNLNSLRYDSKTSSLKYPNVFTIANIVMSNSAYISQQIEARRQKQSVFATAQLGYKESIFLDVTARNDWSSTLAFTPHEKSGFFYPSAGVSWIINRSLTMPPWISFAKLRGVYSKVGNDIPLFITHPVGHVGAGGEIQSADSAPFEDMKPEMTTSLEMGTEWRLLNDLISLNVTYYKTNTRNQFFQLPAQTGDKYAYRYVNAGNIQNTGWEVGVEATPLKLHGFTWKTALNYSTNKNKVIRLHDELPVFIYGPRGFSSSYAMKLVEGGSFGDIYGKAFRRDEAGNILYETEGDKKGLPQVEGEGNLIKVGNCSPRFNMSWGNTLNYRNFSLYFLIDGRFGGDILSQTQADMDLFGVTKETGEARDRGYIELEGHRIEDVKGFYKEVVGGRAGVTEYYMYDATNIRLRELSLGYMLPGSALGKNSVVQNIQFSLVARNLFFLYKKAPFDPDLVLSTGNDNQGIEVYGMPTTRSIGFAIKCEF